MKMASSNGAMNTSAITAMTISKMRQARLSFGWGLLGLGAVGRFGVRSSLSGFTTNVSHMPRVHAKIPALRVLRTQ